MTITGGNRGTNEKPDPYLHLRQSVIRYKINGDSEDLPNLKTGRYLHACGLFTNSDGDIVSRFLFFVFFVEFEQSPCADEFSSQIFRY